MPRIADTTDKLQPLLHPLCPACQQPMRLVLVAPHGQKERSEIRTFECKLGHHITQTVKL